MLWMGKCVRREMEGGELNENKSKSQKWSLYVTVFVGLVSKCQARRKKKRGGQVLLLGLASRLLRPFPPSF